MHTKTKYIILAKLPIQIFMKTFYVLCFAMLPTVLAAQSKENPNWFPSDNAVFMLMRAASPIDTPEKKQMRDTVTLTYSKLSDSVMQITYGVHCRTLINPYNFDYHYEITRQEGYEVAEMTAMVNPFDMYFDKNNVVCSYEGDKIKYPHHLDRGDTLPMAMGTFTLNIRKGQVVLTYNTKLYNRRVIEEVALMIGGELHKAYLIESNYEIQRTIGSVGVVMSTTREQIREWLVKGYGIVQQTRIDNQNCLWITPK